MQTHDHDTLTQLADRYGGPVLAWTVNALTWLAGGMSPLTVLGTLAALWWTVERARTERAKRRAIEGFAETDRRMWGKLRDRLSRWGSVD